MGKKTKKTKWRTLEIPSPGKHYESVGANARWQDGRPSSSANYQHCDKIFKGQRVASTTSSSTAVRSSNFTFSSSTDEQVKTLIEDEYTKITTPRQDVLFKKGYLTKRKILDNTCSENTSDNDIDGIAQQDCTNSEDYSNYANGTDSLPQLVCSAPQSYIDPSSAIYYGGGYEIYDPYTGSVTAVVVGAPAGQSLLTSMSCRPVPLQPVQWFNPVPSSEWCCSYAQQNGKRYSTDSQNEHGSSGVSSESSCAPESPTSVTDDPANNNAASTCTFPSSYVYPGYMFGAPVYNVDGVNIQYCTAESTVLSGSESTITKKKKKRKRRRRVGETEDGSESSVDETCNRSTSSNECILDCTFREEFTEYDDNLQNGNSNLSFQVNSCKTDLPHANVNAPPFVPAAVAVAAAAAVATTAAAGDAGNSFMKYAVAQIDQLEELSTQSDSLFNTDSVGNDRICKNGNYVIANSNSPPGLDVFCKSYNTVADKRDNDVGSSSNNSDSGISSPGSEDSSLTAKDFRKFAKGERSQFNGSAEISENVVAVTAAKTFDTASPCTPSSHLSSATTSTCSGTIINTISPTSNRATCGATAPVTTADDAICNLAGTESSNNDSRYCKNSHNHEITNDDSRNVDDDNCMKSLKIDRNEHCERSDEKLNKKNRTKKSSKVKNRQLPHSNEEKNHEPISNVNDIDKTVCKSLENARKGKYLNEDSTVRRKTTKKTTCAAKNIDTTNRVENEKSESAHIRNGNISEISDSSSGDGFPVNCDETGTKLKGSNFSGNCVTSERTCSNINGEALNGRDDYTLATKSKHYEAVDHSFASNTSTRSFADENNVTLVISDSSECEKVETNQDFTACSEINSTKADRIQRSVLDQPTEHYPVIVDYDRYNAAETLNISTKYTDRSRLCDQNSSMKDSTADQPIRIEEKPLLAKLVEVDQLVEDDTESIPHLEEISFSNFASCRENTNSTPSLSSQRKKFTRQMIETTAQSLIEEIIQQAEARVYSSIRCDKFQLPITQAVTNWLNERGGLPTVETDQLTHDNVEYERSEVLELEEHHNSSSFGTKKSTKSGSNSKSTRSRTGCIIC